MTDHLPECQPDEPHPCACDDCCICSALRACEQRVRNEYIPESGRGWGEYMAYKDGINNGFAAGLSAARDAVAALPHQDGCCSKGCACQTWDKQEPCDLSCNCSFWWMPHALAAIDALRGDDA